MKMLTFGFLFFGLLLSLSCQAEQRLVQETFETGIPGKNIVGNSTSDQSAIWRGAGEAHSGQLIPPAAATYGVDKETGVPQMILAAASRGVGYVTLACDLDNFQQLRVKIGFLNLNGTDMNFQFMIGARKSSVAIAYGYVFQREEGGFQVYYKGAPDSVLVPVSDRKLNGKIKNLELVVGKDFQQLHVDGQRLDDKPRPTQAVAGQGVPHYLDLITITRGSSNTFSDPKLQQLAIVAD